MSIILSLLAPLFAPLLRLFGYGATFVAGRESGKKAEELRATKEQARANAEAIRRRDAATASAPKDGDEAIRRLRDGSA